MILSLKRINTFISYIPFLNVTTLMWKCDKPTKSKCFCVIYTKRLKLRLTHFWPMFPFYTPWKHQTTKGSLVFSGGIKWEHWPKWIKKIHVLVPSHAAHLKISKILFLTNCINSPVYPVVMNQQQEFSLN